MSNNNRKKKVTNITSKPLSGKALSVFVGKRGAKALKSSLGSKVLEKN